MIPIDLALRIVAELIDRSHLPAPLAAGWSAFVVDVVVPLVGELDIERSAPEDVEVILLGLEQSGVRPPGRLLAHYSLIYAFDLAVAFGWTDDNAAARARPV